MKKDSMNNRLMILVIATFIIAIVGLGFLLFGNKKMSKIEENKLSEIGSTYIPYLHYYTDVDKNENEFTKYVLFAVNYYYNEEGKEEVSFKDIRKLAKEVFGINVKDKDLEKVGLITYMIENGINYTPGSKMYTISQKNTMPELAQKEITKYNQIKAVKKSGSTYVVTYEKYTVEKPYELMNYYMDKSQDTKNKDAAKDKKIADEILEYLRGKAKVGTIVNYINKDNIKRCGKVGNKITITYKSTDDGLVISKIK